MGPDIESLPLRDIHLPEPVSWWPPAPGWWALVVLVVIACIAWLVYRRQKRLRLMRDESLLSLAEIRSQFNQHADAMRTINDISALLRRIAITLFPRRDVASLTGSEWLKFLDEVVSQPGQPRHLFDTSLGELLITVQYQQSAKGMQIPIDDLFATCSEWINALPLYDAKKGVLQIKARTVEARG